MHIWKMNGWPLQNSTWRQTPNPCLVAQDSRTQGSTALRLGTRAVIYPLFLFWHLFLGVAFISTTYDGASRHGSLFPWALLLPCLVARRLFAHAECIGCASPSECRAHAGACEWGCACCPVRGRTPPHAPAPGNDAALAAHRCCRRARDGRWCADGTCSGCHAAHSLKTKLGERTDVALDRIDGRSDGGLHARAVGV